MKKSILGIVAIVVMMAVVMAGCPSPTTDEDPVFNGVLYEDGFTPLLTEPLYWNGDNGFAVDGDTNTKYSGSTSFKVDWSQATAWNAVGVSRGSGQTPSGTLNLTAFDALTFYAKAEAETTIEKFGFAAGSEYEIFLKDPDNHNSVGEVCPALAGCGKTLPALRTCFMHLAAQTAVLFTLMRLNSKNLEQ